MSDDGLAVSQDVNSYPAVFVSDFPVAGQTFRTTVSVGPNNDDDQVGFVIGYEVGDSTNDGADYLLVDWKKQGPEPRFQFTVIVPQWYLAPRSGRVSCARCPLTGMSSGSTATWAAQLRGVAWRSSSVRQIWEEPDGRSNRE